MFMTPERNPLNVCSFDRGNNSIIYLQILPCDIIHICSFFNKKMQPIFNFCIYLLEILIFGDRKGENITGRNKIKPREIWHIVR